jgi:hypothetical protein
MSMAGDIAIEYTIHAFVKEIERTLKKATEPAAREALKKIGRYALTLFDWSTPTWAMEYEELFKPEDGREK